MTKRNDNIILAMIGFFLGILFITQYYSAAGLKKVTQPENNEVIALEVAKLTKTNADLRSEVKDLTQNLDAYRSGSATAQEAFDQYQADIVRLNTINGASTVSGQGVIINADGVMFTPQVVDLVNAIKNIGSETIEINGTRLILNTNLSQFSGLNHYEIKVLGNSKLLVSALERKGGIIEQIATKDIKFSIAINENLEIVVGKALQLNYSKIVQ